MRIVILGSGRLGSRLANALAAEDNQVDVVDNDDTKFKSLEERPNIQRILGNIFDEETAQAVFETSPDLFIVVTGKDNVNLMVAQAMKKQYHIPRVLVRVFDPTLAKVYRDLGMETVCPTNFAIQEIQTMIRTEA
jgi:trk system potassium uptake protein TrkA